MFKNECNFLSFCHGTKSFHLQSMIYKMMYQKKGHRSNNSNYILVSYIRLGHLRKLPANEATQTYRNFLHQICSFSYKPLPFLNLCKFLDQPGSFDLNIYLQIKGSYLDKYKKTYGVE